MPRPVSDSIADGLPLWDTYEAFFFLLTGISLGLVLGFLFPSVWRSFRRRFRKLERYKPDKVLAGPLVPLSHNELQHFLIHSDVSEEPQHEVDLVPLFVSARYAVQENALREAASFYLQILGSERVTRSQTNKAMFELSQVYALSGLTAKAIETSLELLHRKPTHVEVFRHLLKLVSQTGEKHHLELILELYSGPVSGELAREVAWFLSEVAARLLREGELPEQRQRSVRLAKLAVRWNPTAIMPKLILIESTSVLWRIVEQRPADQWLTGFCADLTELVRLRESNQQLSPFAFARFLNDWFVQLDARTAAVEAVLQNMPEELTSQLKMSAHQKGGSDLDYGFVWDILEKWHLNGRSLAQADASGSRPGWEDRFRSLFQTTAKSKRFDPLHECGACSQIYRAFEWRCSNCGRWETLRLWAPSVL